MKLVKVKKEELDYFYSLLEQDFCFDERKTKEDVLKDFSNPSFKPCFIKNGKMIIGYFSYWEFDSFIYGEHFAILKELRNQNIGSNFLKQFLTLLKKIFIFEVEKPTDELSQRRINFYLRNGIQFNKFKYFQPSYHKGTDKIPMLIASYPNKLSYKEFLNYTKFIKKAVYQS